jgi:hypothetical protein
MQGDDREREVDILESVPDRKVEVGLAVGAPQRWGRLDIWHSFEIPCGTPSVVWWLKEV